MMLWQLLWFPYSQFFCLFCADTSPSIVMPCAHGQHDLAVVHGCAGPDYLLGSCGCSQYDVHRGAWHTEQPCSISQDPGKKSKHTGICGTPLHAMCQQKVAFKVPIASEPRQSRCLRIVYPSESAKTGLFRKKECMPVQWRWMPSGRSFTACGEVKRISTSGGDRSVFGPFWAQCQLQTLSNPPLRPYLRDRWSPDKSWPVVR